jgi:hypothetical protein
VFFYGAMVMRNHRKEPPKCVYFLKLLRAMRAKTANAVPSRAVKKVTPAATLRTLWRPIMTSQS